MRIVIALMLLCTAAARAAGPGAYYFIAVQNGAYNFNGGTEQLAESYKVLQGMVKLADAQGARLTLMFSAPYAVYIATDPARLTELEGWKKTGHEIGAYHQGPDKRAWDGYSDLSKEDLARVRKEDRKGAPAPGHREYFEALSLLASDIKSGCMQDGVDKKFIAAAPEYEICGGSAKNGRSGVNESFPAGSGDKAKKRLSCFNPADKAGLEAAKDSFSGLSLGVYGAAFKSSPSEFGAFYSWLSFLRGKDPQGLRSRTVSSIVVSGLLPEKEAGPAPEARKTKKPGVQPQPEVPKTEIPRLKPVPYRYGTVGSPDKRFEPRLRNTRQRGYCGDGICDVFERVRSGRCPRDCGK